MFKRSVLAPLLATLALSACVDSPVDESTASQDIRTRCPTTDPDCEAPPDDPPPPPPGHGQPEPTPPGEACDALVTGSVSASPLSATYAPGIPMGSTITIYWDVQIPTTCTPSGGITLGGVTVGTSGAMTFTINASRNYPLQVGTKQVANLSIITQLPNPMHITSNTVEQRMLFAQAAQTPGETVLLRDDLELDLTAYSLSGIFVADGVTITSETPNARDARHLGPKLYSTYRPTGLLWITHPHVVLRGIRVIGPDMGMTSGFGKGIVISSTNQIELDRLEVAGFSEAAVYIIDHDGVNNAFSDITIHDSFFHHNQRAPGGDGYGVVVSHGAKAYIQHNVFDFNRHAIASTEGLSGTGYYADENLVLKGGGYHEFGYGVSWQTHIFDVHGANSCGVISGDSSGNCGPAGEAYFITGNTFQYSAGLDFKLRGTPSVGAWLTDNIFPKAETASVEQYESGMHLLNNTGSKQTFGKYGVCDFDGDGIDDLFLATGRTWWFSSGGKYHWTYMNDQLEDLSKLGLGDFNHDGRCDVMRELNNTWQISSGGTSQFVSLPPGFSGPISQLRFADFNGDGFKDVFQRAPGGQWYAYYRFDVAVPVALQSSGWMLDEMRFGDFDGDGKTDVMSLNGDIWSWSRSGATPWLPFNSRYHSFDNVVMVANVDGRPGDDLVTAFLDPFATGPDIHLSVSSGGSTAWTPLVVVPVDSYYDFDVKRQYETFLFPGRFGGAMPSLLRVDSGDRFTSEFRAGWAGFLTHSLYAH